MSILSDSDILEILLFIHEQVSDKFADAYDRETEDLGLYFGGYTNNDSIISQIVEGNNFTRQFFIKKNGSYSIIYRHNLISGKNDILESPKKDIGEYLRVCMKMRIYNIISRHTLDSESNDISQYIMVIRERIANLTSTSLLFKMKLFETITSMKDVAEKIDKNGSTLRQFMFELYRSLTFSNKRELFRRIPSLKQFYIIYVVLKYSLLDSEVSSSVVDGAGVSMSAAAQRATEEFQPEILRNIPCPHFKFVVRYFARDPESKKLHRREGSGIPAILSQIDEEFFFQFCKLEEDISCLREYIGQDNFEIRTEHIIPQRITRLFLEQTNYSFFRSVGPKLYKFRKVNLDEPREMTAEILEALIILKQIYDEFMHVEQMEENQYSTAASASAQKRRKISYYRQYVFQKM